ALDAPLAEAWQSVAPRELLIPNGVATTGFALPAALAAALARDDVRVVAMGAASGVAAMVGELATMTRLGLPVVVVAFDQDGTAAAMTEAAREAGVVTALAWSAEAFGACFTHAWTAARPALIVAGVRG
ncbi:MAG TPA: thiamine pyrophosphate-dependent enzyme, partial [Methylomirabilota bacterium]|nr:thiamine pyrophosphate-dependent enzyme [Methylomirabilota bacterium]